MKRTHPRRTNQPQNAIAANPSVPFYILLVASFVITMLLSFLWDLVVKPEEGGEERPSGDFWGAAFLTFQVLITGGYDDSIVRLDERLIFFTMVMAGVLVVSILIGLITDSVTGYLDSLDAGASKVCESGHTLILGWNEATPRVICQIAFLRRTWQVQVSEKECRNACNRRRNKEQKKRREGAIISRLFSTTLLPLLCVTQRFLCFLLRLNPDRMRPGCGGLSPGCVSRRRLPWPLIPWSSSTTACPSRR